MGRRSSAEPDCLFLGEVGRSHASQEDAEEKKPSKPTPETGSLGALHASKSGEDSSMDVEAVHSYPYESDIADYTNLDEELPVLKEESEEEEESEDEEWIDSGASENKRSEPAEAAVEKTKSTAAASFDRTAEEDAEEKKPSKPTPKTGSLGALHGEGADEAVEKKRSKSTPETGSLGALHASKSGEEGDGKPQWNPSARLATGGDKEVFMGTFKGKPVAICKPKGDVGLQRLNREINVLKQLGKHPHIVEMLYSEHGAFIALEAVEPIGFDLDCLVKQYSFANQCMPSLLARSIITHLCGALTHMHGHKFVHRDIKLENILINKKSEPKVIDMGIACEIGVQEKRWVWEPRSYHAPETCQGSTAQGPEVDVWGLGLILHQIYQQRWDLIDASGSKVVMCPERPSVAEPMENSLLVAMLGMLEFDPAKRWSVKDCESKIHHEGPTGENPDGWLAPAAEKRETRKLLTKYKDAKSPISTYAAIVDIRNTHLHNKRVDELEFCLKFSEEHKAVLLLVDNDHVKVGNVPSALKRKRILQKVPKGDTVIEPGAWLYFGMPPCANTENAESAVCALTKDLFPNQGSPRTPGRSTNAKAGMMAFTLEFDCFQFPPHIPRKAVIGDKAIGPDAIGLNLNQRFGVNLAGIVRKGCSEPEWFPGPSSMVSPGDLGLVVRCPCQDGTTDPTVTDEQLTPLMNINTFEVRMKEQKAEQEQQLAGRPGGARSQSLKGPPKTKPQVARMGRRGTEPTVVSADRLKTLAALPKQARAVSATAVVSKLTGNHSAIHPDVGVSGTIKAALHMYWVLQCSLLTSGKWMLRFVRFAIFVTLMLPGFLPPMWSYVSSARIVKNVVYGPKIRQQLDVYLCGSEKRGQQPAPVVIFVSGGAWIIGYKAWGFIMGQLFQKHRVCFVAMDYRNYPQATMESMVQDVMLAVQWVFNNIEEIGGNPEQISLMGQSAGAHLSAMAVLERAKAELSGINPQEGAGVIWSTRKLARWIGISGPYDLVGLLPHLCSRGMPFPLLKALVGKDPMLVSPLHMVRDVIQLAETRRDRLQGLSSGAGKAVGGDQVAALWASVKQRDSACASNTTALELLPACHIFHGDADATVPWQQAEVFATELRRGGVDTHTKWYKGKSHTDPILEDPCEGNGDELMSDLLAMVGGKEGTGCDNMLCWQPKLLLKWARFCNPF